MFLLAQGESHKRRRPVPRLLWRFTFGGRARGMLVSECEIIEAQVWQPSTPLRSARNEGPVACPFPFHAS